MNVHDRVDLEADIASVLDQSLLETWNAGELASDLVDALLNLGYEINKRAERCRFLSVDPVKDGISEVWRCTRTEHEDDDHKMARVLSGSFPRVLP